MQYKYFPQETQSPNEDFEEPMSPQSTLNLYNLVQSQFNSQRLLLHMWELTEGW